MLNLLCLFVFFFTTSSLAALDVVYLTWQKDPTTTMTISWLAKPEENKKSLEYRPSGKDDAWKTKQVENVIPLQNSPYVLYRVECVDLTPDTLYSFRVPQEQEQHLFRTMPKTNDQPICFAVGGDMYDNSLETFEQTSKAAAKHNPRFVLVGGDIAYSVSNKHKRVDDLSRWLTFFSSWTKLLKDSQGAHIPILAAIGNHEVMGYFNETPASARYFYTFFPTPNDQGYQAVRFGGYMSVMILDSGHTHPIAGAQAAWLEQELKKQIATKHRFAIYHVPAFPSARSFRGTISTSIRRNWCPLFEKYGIHAVFEHHDHAYKRTFPLVNSSPDRFGVVYFGDGGWGAKPRIPKTASRTSYLAKTKYTQQFLIVEVTKTTRTYSAYNPESELIDRHIQPLDKPY